MLEQKERARSSSNFNSIIPESLDIKGETDFLGYESYSSTSNVIEIISNSSSQEEINEGEENNIDSNTDEQKLEPESLE